MKIFFLIFILNAFTLKPQKTNDSSELISSSEKSPEYPGGMVAFAKFFSHKLSFNHLPDSGHMGCCTLHFKFHVDKSGKATFTELLRNPCYISDAAEQIKQVIDQMPLWNPAIKDGNPVNTYLSFPFRIRLY